MKVLCSHNIDNKKFVCNDPDGPGILKIKLLAGIPKLIDIRIAERYPSTFTIIEEEKTIQEVTEVIVKEIAEDIVEATEIEIAHEEPEPVDVVEEEEIVEPEPTPVDVVEEPVIPEPVKPMKTLIEIIDDFKVKKRLDVFAETQFEIKLDGRSTLKKMKAALKAELKLA